MVENLVIGVTRDDLDVLSVLDRVDRVEELELGDDAAVEGDVGFCRTRVLEEVEVDLDLVVVEDAVGVDDLGLLVIHNTSSNPDQNPRRSSALLVRHNNLQRY